MTITLTNVKEEFLPHIKEFSESINADFKINTEKPRFEKVREILKANLQKPKNYAVFERLIYKSLKITPCLKGSKINELPFA